MNKFAWTRCCGSIAVLVSVVSAPISAYAFTLTTFTDRASWEASVAGSFSEENFNSFTTDSSFNNQNLDIGDFTLNGIGSRQKIDVPSLEVPSFSVDGTSMILGQTDSSSSFTITFDSPITAFGADFDDISSQGITRLFANSNFAGNIPLDADFWGFTADSNVIQLALNSANNDFDGFGMDNLVYVQSTDIPFESSPTFSLAVPKPPSSNDVNASLFGNNSNLGNNPDAFLPVEFSPSYSIPLSSVNIGANVPFEFSPTLGLLCLGGILVVSRLRRRFSS